MKTFIVLSTAGVHRDLAKGSREQPYWDEHAAFIDGLVDEGFILMGGPLVDDGGAMLIVHAEDETPSARKCPTTPGTTSRS